MKKSLAANFIAFVAVAVVMATSCDPFDTKNAGDGSPSGKNVVLHKDWVYTYTSSGLVESISAPRYVYDGEGNVSVVMEILADISYPSSNRAVMKYYGQGDVIKYTFFFGENGFAYEIRENSGDGDGDIVYNLQYDESGHLIKFGDVFEYLTMEWKDGNVVKISEGMIAQESYDAYCTLTYGTASDFWNYNMSPFLFDVELGPLQYDLSWWIYDGVECGFYAGFCGHPNRNLPDTITSYDNKNDGPTRSRFVYDDEFGRYSMESI